MGENCTIVVLTKKRGGGEGKKRGGQGRGSLTSPKFKKG